MKEIFNLSDEKLMNLYAEGEYDAFKVLYKRYKAKIYSYINRKVFDSDMREEVFQNIFMKLHKTRGLYNDDFLFAQWIYTIARTSVLDFLKKRKIETVEFFEIASDNETLDVEIDLSSLSQKEKSVIELKYFSDQDYEEIAKQLNLTNSNVRKIASRAITALRKKKV